MKYPILADVMFEGPILIVFALAMIFMVITAVYTGIISPFCKRNFSKKRRKR